MKVLNVLFNNSMGGPGIRALSIARELRKFGIETVWLVPDEEGDYAFQAVKEGFRVYKVVLDKPRFFTDPQSIILNTIWFFRFFFSVIIIYKLIKKERIDIVHVNGILNLQATLAGFLARRKIVWHLISSLYPKFLILILAPYVRLIANQKVVVAKKMAKYYRLNVNDDDVSVIYEPVDINKFDPICVQKNDLTKVGINLGLIPRSVHCIIGCVANISSVKGFEYLIKSGNILKRKGYNIKLVIIGGKVDSQRWYYRKLRDLVLSLKMEGDIIFAGRRNDVPLILTLFDIFVMPSIAEGTPLAILEAMAMEKPIIATDVGGISEQIINYESGILVPPKDSMAIAKAVIFLLKNSEETIKMGKRARERVKRMFFLEKCVEEHRKMYETIKNRRFNKC